MATWVDVSRIALSLPDAVESDMRGNRAWKVADNGRFDADATGADWSELRYRHLLPDPEQHAEQLLHGTAVVVGEARRTM